MFSLKSFALGFCGFTQRYVKYSVVFKKIQLIFLFEIKVVMASDLTQFKILCIWRPKHRLVQYVFMDLRWIYGPRTNWCVLKNQLLWIWILVLSFS